jgi:polysaccharide export outer membrane protein
MKLSAHIGNRSAKMTVSFFLISLLITLGGCSTSNHKTVEKEEFASGPALSPDQCEANARVMEASYQESGYRIQPNDKLSIDFYLNSEFNDNVTVSPDGKIVLKMVGAIKAAGLTPDQLADRIDDAYKSELRNPGAVVHVQNTPGRRVYVQGEVTRPGSFQIQPGMTAVQAVALAGGLTTDASGTAVLIRRDACGEPEGSKIKLAVAMKDPSKGDDVALMPRDVVVVPRSTIASMDLWMKQYVRDLMPVQPYIGIPF